MDKTQTGEKAHIADAMVRRAGLRMTRQRQAVMKVVLDSTDHPTVAQIFDRVKYLLPSLSLATVYNCLETMSRARLINQLHFDNGPSRFCPNLSPHAHFVDEDSLMVYDVKLKPGVRAEEVFDLPSGFNISHMEVCLHGHTKTKIPQ